MGQPKSAYVKEPKGKTPAQVAKAQANMVAAAERLKKLQTLAKTAKQIRERHSLVGSDNVVLDAYRGIIECDVAIFVQERFEAKMAAAQAKYVADSLAGPSSWHLNRFLAHREPTFKRVLGFFLNSKMPRIASDVPAKKAA